MLKGDLTKRVKKKLAAKERKAMKVVKGGTPAQRKVHKAVKKIVKKAGY